MLTWPTDSREKRVHNVLLSQKILRAEGGEKIVSQAQGLAKKPQRGENVTFREEVVL